MMETESGFYCKVMDNGYQQYGVRLNADPLQKYLNDYVNTRHGNMVGQMCKGGSDIQFAVTTGYGHTTSDEYYTEIKARDNVGRFISIVAVGNIGIILMVLTFLRIEALI